MAWRGRAPAVEYRAHCSLSICMLLGAARKLAVSVAPKARRCALHCWRDMALAVSGFVNSTIIHISQSLVHSGVRHGLFCKLRLARYVRLATLVKIDPKPSGIRQYIPCFVASFLLLAVVAIVISGTYRRPPITYRR